MEVFPATFSAAAVLTQWLLDARRRTVDLTSDLTDAQLLGPELATVNPLLWEIGHVAWFQERWLRRRNGAPSLRPDADMLYDSSAVPHATRWDLRLPSRAETLGFMAEVLERVLDPLQQREPSREEAYFLQLALFHEDMHAEAFLMTRQTLAYARPRGLPRTPASASGPCAGDVAVPGGDFALGATPGNGFVFDNEKWSHPVSVQAFAIARGPVTQAEFAAFVDDGAYRRRELWSEEGWSWRNGAGAEHPLSWEKRTPGGWWRRRSGSWLPLEPDLAVFHVNFHEADAYCRWAGRRLPTEAEWELAAIGRTVPKPRFPWGDDEPGSDMANVSGLGGGVADVAACSAGDSQFGCRQMIGNVWEWTASPFEPYPGFTPDPYRDYSQPWFGTHRVLRGGSWATQARLLRATWRNFYLPERRDVWAGFRTCALS